MVINDKDIFDAMKSIVQPVERVIEDAQRFGHMRPTPLRMLCGWCPDHAVQMQAANELAEDITTGICPQCLAKLEGG